MKRLFIQVSFCRQKESPRIEEIRTKIECKHHILREKEILKCK